LKTNKNKQANTSRFRVIRRNMWKVECLVFSKRNVAKLHLLRYFRTFVLSTWERRGQQLQCYLLRVILQISVEICENIPIFVKIREHNGHFPWTLYAFPEATPVGIEGVKIGKNNVFFNEECTPVQYSVHSLPKS